MRNRRPGFLLTALLGCAGVSTAVAAEVGLAVDEVRPSQAAAQGMLKLQAERSPGSKPSAKIREAPSIAAATLWRICWRSAGSLRQYR